MEMKVDRKAAIKKLRTLVITPKSEVEPFRSKIEETFDTVFLPNHVERSEHDYGGVKCDILVPEVYSSRRVMLYIHGGSFAGGSRDSWRAFCSSLAHASSSRVVVPEFRLPPTHVYPAALEDLQTVFRMLFAEEQISMQIEDSKAEPEIVIAADGSGASLAVALLLKLRDRYRSCVQNLVLLSPWLDFTSDSPLIAGKRVADEVMSGEALHRAVDLYTYATNISNPLVSPLKAPVQNFIGFPPVYIQMGEKEILLEQAKQFAELLKEAAVECTLDVWPKMMFMFQMADEYLSEPHLAVEKLGNYISARDEDDIDVKAELMKKHNMDFQRISTRQTTDKNQPQEL
jgi:acetyl esterase/lipase